VGETVSGRSDVPFDATLTADGDAVVKLAAAVPVDAKVHDRAEGADLPAAILERYEGLTLLGRGGMGVVYRAHDRQLGRDVALKLLFDDKDDQGQSLLREARSQARLDHPHACKVYEVGVAEGKAYLVMQLIDGSPFDRAQEQMTLEEKVNVVRQVASALHQAHRFGLVHRDVKPSNIMVERGEDGAWKPYLMDFGIAREIGGQGQTLTGAIAGTPAFMAPEQARGEVRSLDRRTDVYSLGATLYDVLAGRPPFRAANAWDLLRQIMTEEAPAIRTLDRRIPADLEAIVGCCLEKEPYRRYDSAKALGEDLQRFLDGDPVHARRLSRAYVLFRKARKHKLVVALAGAALLAVVVVAALSLRARRIAAEQASLAGELGEDVKEMELFLRTAYGLPLHDVEREKDIVRARLHTIEGRMAAAGRAGVGPGHYALGRGHLSLDEPEEARRHLEQASAAGYASPELDYSLGLALGQLGEKAREAAKRIGNPAQKKAREAAIKADYEEPARSHLRASLGARLETASYAEGLLLLGENKPEEAIVKAQEAFAKMPWLYEAKKLEADAHFALGSRFRQDGAFDYARMDVDFQAAFQGYEIAGAIARSDARVHLAECELWFQYMNAGSARPESLKPSFEKARSACTRAMTASSRSEDAAIKLAFVEETLAWAFENAIVPGDPVAVLEQAISTGEDARRRSPNDPMAPYVLCESWRMHARHLSNAGLEFRASLDRAATMCEDAIRLDPTFLWAIQALADVLAQRGLREIYQGLDPQPSLEKAIELSRRAAELDPSSFVALTSGLSGYLILMGHLVDRGRDPAAPVAQMQGCIDAATRLSRDSLGLDFYVAYGHWNMAAYQLDAGQDPTLSLERGTQVADLMAKGSGAEAEADEMLGHLGTTRALYLAQRGEDPEPELHKAREVLRRAAAGKMWDITFPVMSAQAEIVGLRWAAKRRGVAPEAFAAARAPLLPWLSQERVDPRLYLVLAEIHQIEAAWLLEGSKSADPALAEGLAMADKALHLNPHMARALLVKGTLLLARADAARGAKERSRAVLDAGEALSAAVKENPLLEREVAPLRLSLKKAQAR
jgi:serine/threonine-protein kinase